MPIAANKCRLEELVSIRGGHPFRSSVDAVPEGSVAVVQMKDILPNSQIDWSAVVTTELTRRKDPDWLRLGDLLFVARGNRYHAAHVAQLPAQSVCGAHLFHLTVNNPATLIPAFLAWQISQSPIQRQLQQAASGSNQLSIARPALEALTITVPPLAVQQRIVQMAASALREKAVLTALIRNREQELDALAIALASACTHHAP